VTGSLASTSLDGRVALVTGATSGYITGQAMHLNGGLWLA
jgi:hypothetical protein